MKYAIILALLLSGCGTIEKYCKEVILVDPKETVQVDPRALEECKDLALLPDKNVTFEAVLSNVAENSVIYSECRNKQSNSIVIIKRFANIKDTK